MGKTAKEKFKTYKSVFDDFTERNLFKLASQGYYEEPLYPVALGKESNVFYALRKDGKKVIVKIYRLENCDFNRMYDYIKSDDRYQNIKKSRRHVIFAWTQREYRNLHKARDSGVNVPTPLTFMHNILIEEFIGEDEPAPMLKNSSIKDPEKLFRKILMNMKKLFKGGLVHGDLSSFNILIWKDEPIFIDFSQSTEKTSMHANELLQRDILNVGNFFSKLGIEINKEKIEKDINTKK